MARDITGRIVIPGFKRGFRLSDDARMGRAGFASLRIVLMRGGSAFRHCFGQRLAPDGIGPFGDAIFGCSLPRLLVESVMDKTGLYSIGVRTGQHIAIGVKGQALDDAQLIAGASAPIGLVIVMAQLLAMPMHFA